MQLIEVLAGRLYQSDAERSVGERLRERGLLPAMIIDLHGGGAWEAASGELVYVRWPIDDATVPHVPTLLGLAQTGAEFIEAGGVVVSMCQMGRNRSGLLSALIVMRCEGMSGAEAVRFVRERCPEALGNDAFVAFLVGR
ncbi:MAG: hypothetical protein WEC75_05895 [Dehalococcoidia bacterium]